MISWLRKKWKEWVEDWRIAGERSRATVAYACSNDTVDRSSNERNLDAAGPGKRRQPRVVVQIDGIGLGLFRRFEDCIGLRHDSFAQRFAHIFRCAGHRAEV